MQANKEEVSKIVSDGLRAFEQSYDIRQRTQQLRDKTDTENSKTLTEINEIGLNMHYQVGITNFMDIKNQQRRVLDIEKMRKDEGERLKASREQTRHSNMLEKAWSAILESCTSCGDDISKIIKNFQETETAHFQYFKKENFWKEEIEKIRMELANVRNEIKVLDGNNSKVSGKLTVELDLANKENIDLSNRYSANVEEIKETEQVISKCSELIVKIFDAMGGFKEDKIEPPYLESWRILN